MTKQKRILSLVLVLAMLFSLSVPVTVRAEETGYTYLSEQEMYNWLAAQQGSAVRPVNLNQAEHCINDFHPADWVLAVSKEDIFQQIVSLTDSLVSGKGSETEKALAIYNWISQNVAYDDTAREYYYKLATTGVWPTEEESARVSQAADAFYTFYNRRAICDGYAHLSWLMLTIAEIPSAWIVGNAHLGEAHAWNAACVDGRWILFDATWSKWDIAPDYHHPGTIEYSDGVFSRSLSADGAVWYWIFQGYPCPAHVEIPAGVVEINMESFINCTGMTSVTIPDGVTYIGASAFEGCTSLTSITIPASVTTIKRDAFKNCTSLSDITFLGDMPKIEDGAFSGTLWMQGQGDFAITGSILMKYTGSDYEVVIPSGVTAIADGAFDVNLWITRVVIPEGVTSIGKRAFRQCISLTDISIPASVNFIRADAFYLTPWVKNQGDFVVINGILVAYQGPDVREIVIPDGVRDIADGALCYNGKNVRSITLPASLTRIGRDVFNHSYLEEIYFKGSKAQWDAIDIEMGGTNWRFRDWDGNTAVIHYNVP